MMYQTGGCKHFKSSILSMLAVLVLAGMAAAADARAYDRKEFRARLEARRVERQVRLDASRAAREERRQEREQENAEEEPSALACECRARIKNVRPVVQWTSGGLKIVPYVDLDIRVKGEGTEDWKLDLNYEGLTSFEVDKGDIAIPGGQTFSGSDSWYGSCMDTRWDIEGHKLNGVTVSSLLWRMFGSDDDVDGRLVMTSKVTGCDVEADADTFRIDIRPFGNLRVR